MKITYFIALIIALTLTTPLVLAQTPTEEVIPTKEVTPTKATDTDVDKLKEKVAETVLGMKEGQETAVSGTIVSVKGDVMKLSTDDKDIEVTLDDALTEYFEVQGTVTKEIKKEALKKNDYLFVLGPEINGSITANSIYKDQRYLSLVGKITEVNVDDFTVKIVALDKTNYILDVQTRTTQELLNIKTVTPEKIGFTKLKEGDSIHAFVKANNENPKSTRFDAERILVIPNEYFIQ
jgi:hypothetical protein